MCSVILTEYHQLSSDVRAIIVSDGTKKPPNTEIRWTGPCRDATTRFMVASGRGLYEGYGHGGSGVCLSDSQTEA